jgi:ABC-type Mn2+/Zn2+ transport system ATPase subunit
MKPLISLHDLAVGYGAKPVLEGLRVEIAQGSFTALLGTNGSGKTTLLKTIVGILPPLAGRVEFHDANGRAPVLGYVPQRETLDPIYLLSSAEVVLMGTYGRLGAGRLPGRTERTIALDCLEQTGVAGLARHRFSQLSGGQKQRVLIARALAAQPDLLVLDEPTAGIDTTATRAILELLRRLNTQKHLTILMVNHDLGAVRESAQHVVWLNEGRAVQGPAAELLTPAQIGRILHLELN